MEEALSIFEYLPQSFKTQKEGEYINFLWESFESNYANGKYQFAFLGYHMLYMSFVYFIVWQIKNNQQDDFQKALVGFNKNVENGFNSASSPFTFSEVNESNILRFLKLIGCDNTKIGKYTKLVKERNDIAHSNCNIFFSTKEAMDAKIHEALSLVDEIQEQSKGVILKCYGQFLLENYDPEEREYYDSEDQFREILIHQNYLSQKDIEICLEYDVTVHAGHEHYEMIKEFHDSFISAYQNEDE